MSEEPKKFRCRNCDHRFSDPMVYLDKGEKITVCPFCGGRGFE